jgi:phosphate starvation-inducible protein PhoH and related proteins
LTEKKISLTGIDLLNLTGVNESNIELIKNKFDSTIIVRGEIILLKGEDKEIDTLEKIFNELIFLQKRQGHISAHDVKLVIDLINPENGIREKTKEKFGLNHDDINQIILFRKNDYIKPRTATQFEYYQKVKDNDIVFSIGPAGTGKTYLAVAFAVAELKNKVHDRIVLTRPAVEAGENLGFLPGDLSEKVDPYLRPLYDALGDMIPAEKLKSYMEKKIIEVVPLAYMRGRTLNNAFVILDEAQNSTTIQMKMFLTRLGANSKAIINGDITQIDLPKKDMSGLIQIQEILKDIEGIGFVYFNKSDVVRHKLVKDIIDAYEKHNN